MFSNSGVPNDPKQIKYKILINDDSWCCHTNNCQHRCSIKSSELKQFDLVFEKVKKHTMQQHFSTKKRKISRLKTEDVQWFMMIGANKVGISYNDLILWANTKCLAPQGNIFDVNARQNIVVVDQNIEEELIIDDFLYSQVTGSSENCEETERIEDENVLQASLESVANDVIKQDKNDTVLWYTDQRDIHQKGPNDKIVTVNIPFLVNSHSAVFDNDSSIDFISNCIKRLCPQVPEGLTLYQMDLDDKTVIEDLDKDIITLDVYCRYVVNKDMLKPAKNECGMLEDDVDAAGQKLANCGQQIINSDENTPKNHRIKELHGRKCCAHENGLFPNMSSDEYLIKLIGEQCSFGENSILSVLFNKSETVSAIRDFIRKCNLDKSFNNIVLTRFMDELGTIGCNAQKYMFIHVKVW